MVDVPVALALVGGAILFQRLALRGRRGVRLEYDAGEITLSWLGAELDPEVLDHARAIVAALSCARPRGAGYR